MVASSAANPARPRGKPVAHVHVSWATTAMPCAWSAVTCCSRRVRSSSPSREGVRRRPKRRRWTSRMTSSSNLPERKSIPSSRGPGSPQVRRRAVRARVHRDWKEAGSGAATCGPVLVSWAVARFRHRSSRCSARSAACEVALSTVGALPSMRRLGPSRSETGMRHCSSCERSGDELENAVTSADRICAGYRPNAS